MRSLLEQVIGVGPGDRLEVKLINVSPLQETIGLVQVGHRIDAARPDGAARARAAAGVRHRRLRAKPEKIIVDLYAAKPSSRKTPCMASRMVS